MKRKITLIIAAAVIVIAVAYTAVAMLSSQNNLCADRHSGLLGVLPLRGNPLEVEVIPGLRFKIDTGSDISTITPEHLALLDSLGFSHSESFYPVVGRDGNGNIIFESKRYTVSIPLLKYEFIEDSAGCRAATGSWSSANILSGVDFTLSKTGQSVLGIDFLQRFKIEYQYNNRAIALYFEAPAGYDKCVDLKPSFSIFTSLWLGKRYFSEFSVNGVYKPFFLDTGIRNARIKLPSSDIGRRADKLKRDTVTSALGIFPALVDDRADIEMGNRFVNGIAYYYESLEEPYAFNPLNLFLQDVLIDFENGTLSLRPIFNKLSTTPGLITKVSTIN